MTDTVSQDAVVSVVVEGEDEIVVEITQPAPIVVDLTGATRIEVVEVQSPGPPGRDAGIIQLPFSWGDATPSPIKSFTGVVISVSIVVLTPFDGVGATLAVTAPGGVVLQGTDQNIPSVGGRFESNPSIKFSVPTLVSLEIHAGSGASAGNGIVSLEVAQ